MRNILIICTALLGVNAIAQRSLGTNEHVLNQSLRLFEEGEYVRVIEFLSKRKELSLEEHFLLKMSDVKLNQNSVHALEELVTEFSSHPFVPFASFILSAYYFEKQQWNASNNYLKLVQQSSLGSEDLAAYSFMKGYFDLEIKAYKSAKANFERAQLFGYPDQIGLSYFLGLVLYHEGDHEPAIAYFEEIKKDSNYGGSASYFIAQILFEKGQYQEVIEIAQSVLAKDTSETTSAFYQLVGESYAKLDNATKASIYLERAISLTPGDPSPALLYKAGVARFKTGSKEKAIDFFLRSGVQAGEYAQLSAFQLGRIYTSQGEWQLALAAYIEASGSADQQIKEEAIYHAGKLQAKLGEYSESINYLIDYLEMYPNGQWVSEANELLAKAYLRSSNYDQAIDHLKKVGIKTESQKAVYQKVTFAKANLSFNDGQYQESVRWLNESLSHPLDNSLQEDAYYLKGESYFQLNDYSMAISAYDQIKTKDPRTSYGLGYAYYNLFDYEAALGHFNRFLVSNPLKGDVQDDAKLRLADCHFATKSYQEALRLYRDVNVRSRSGAIGFRIGQVLAGLNRNEEAIGAFEKVLSNQETAYGDEALFALSNIYFEEARFDVAEERYNELISRYPNSIFLGRVYLNRAISKTNLGKLYEARDDYLTVLRDHINSENAFDAILGLQELEQKGVEVENLKQLINQYKEANPENTSGVEQVEFESAKASYFQLDYEMAAEAFETFLKDYPGSSNRLEAIYYLGDSYYRKGDLNKAKEQFQKIENTRNNLTGRILSRLGDIHYQLEAFKEAIDTYGLLRTLDLSPKDTYNARLGLMNTYFRSDEYNQCIIVADEILAAEWKPINALRKAHLTKAKCFYALGELDDAASLLASLATEADVLSAEASYLLASVLFEKGSYDESLSQLFDLNKKFASYTKWIDQSYLLIASNYIALDELFQAKATLRSIVLHSKDDEVRSIAQNRLDRIESQQSLDSLDEKDN